MHYLSESDVTRMLGIGHFGEVRQGPDGHLYEYVQGVDGLGNPIGGFWSRLKSVARRAMPLVQKVAPFIPGGAAALTAATPFLKAAGVAGHPGIGELYEAPDGALYRVQGLEADEDLRGLGEDAAGQMMGVGYFGEVRQGPDGNLYQYTQGVDGLGNLTGFWGKLRKVAKTALKYHPVSLALKAARPLVQQALPIAQKVASAVPGGAEAMAAAAPVLKAAGVAGHGSLGALYQAPDGALYQPVNGVAEDELGSLDASDALQGLDEDPELRGFDADSDLNGCDCAHAKLRGLDADEDLRGLEDASDINGLAADPDMQGMDGYLRPHTISGIERYEPERPAQTRWHTPTGDVPEVWKPLW